MRLVLNVEARRMIPWTSYPLASKNSARYEPSCPVMPVTSAFFIRILRQNVGRSCQSAWAWSNGSGKRPRTPTSWRDAGYWQATARADAQENGLRLQRRESCQNGYLLSL